MGFLTPKASEDDDRLPGSGLHLDADPRRCPTCRLEVAPWQARCTTCDEEPVPASQLPAAEMELPPGLASLAALDEDEDLDEHDGDGDGDGAGEDPAGDTS